MFHIKSTALRVATVSIALLSAEGLIAQARSANGSITGSADPGAQIVVTSLDGGQVNGVVAKCDGSYRVDRLKPGRYEIVEGGRHHAVRKLSVTEGQDSHVDLAVALRNQCPAK
jgi:phage gp45-like